MRKELLVAGVVMLAIPAMFIRFWVQPNQTTIGVHRAR